MKTIPYELMTKCTSAGRFPGGFLASVRETLARADGRIVFHEGHGF